MQRNTTDLAIYPDMKNPTIKQKIADAERYFNQPHFSNIKKDILAKLFDYARGYFVGMMARDRSRYNIYNNILEYATQLDDIHFLYFTKKQIRSINDSSSTLRSTTLPLVNNYLEIALAPTVARAQKTFLGMISAGTLMLLSRYAPAGLTLMMTGIAFYTLSSSIVEYRLDRSLALKQNSLLMGGVDSTRLINDGLQDEVSRIENMGFNALSSSLSLLSRASNQLGRIAGQAQPARVEVMDEDTEQDRVANGRSLR